jgi:hypothetical protein
VRSTIFQTITEICFLKKKNLQSMLNEHKTEKECHVLQNTHAAKAQDDPGVRTAVKHLDTTSGRAWAQRLQSSEGSG